MDPYFDSDSDSDDETVLYYDSEDDPVLDYRTVEYDADETDSEYEAEYQEFLALAAIGSGCVTPPE